MQRVWSRVNCKIPDGVASFFCRVASRSVDFTISGGFRRQLAADLARVLSRSAYFGLVQSNKRIIRFRSLPVGGIARPLVASPFFFIFCPERNVVGTVPDVHPTPNTISTAAFFSGILFISLAQHWNRKAQ